MNHTRFVALLGVSLVGCSAGTAFMGEQVDARDAGTADNKPQDLQTDGEEDPPETGEAICDGTPNLRLMVYVVSPAERELRGSAVRVENGFPSMFIDGRCQYWLGGGWDRYDDSADRDRGWRSGTLNPELHEELSNVTQIGNVEYLADCSPTVGVSDASPRVIANAAGAVTCLGGGKKFNRAWLAFQKAGPVLWNAAASLAGGLRVSAIEASVGPDLPNEVVVPWPKDVELSQFFLRSEDEYSSGVAKKVTAASDVMSIRTFRDQYLARRDANSAGFGSGFRVSDGQRGAVVFMRGELPFSDAEGRVTFGGNR